MDYEPIANGGTVLLRDGNECSVARKSVVLAKKLVDGLWSDARIEDVLHVQGLKKICFPLA